MISVFFLNHVKLMLFETYCVYTVRILL